MQERNTEQTASPVVVVGGANVDIGGQSAGPLRSEDSNPGRVRISVGGVGRNIAHNLRLLGLPVLFLTALGKDAQGDRVAAECAMAGIDCERILRTHEAPTSTYLFIADEAGDMHLAISDMEICRQISPDYLSAQADVFSSAAAVVADANLPEESLRYLAERVEAPLFVDPVSAAKAGRIRDILGCIHTLKPNRLEAELLSGITIQTEADLLLAADRLLSTGMKRVFISLGTEGVFAAEEDQRLRIPCCPAAPVNMTGAGDAMMAGLVWSFLQGLSLANSARAAAAAAAIAVEGRHTVNSDLNPAALRQRALQG
ncbi:MAG: carbohydrate kinase family protein [Clostridia bacterium]|nr:carbohydrate kinase family protein [Clostridia bacterium]